MKFEKVDQKFGGALKFGAQKQQQHTCTVNAGDVLYGITSNAESPHCERVV